MKIVLLRHGETLGNRQRRYVGKTDEPLCPAGREALFWAENWKILSFLSENQAEKENFHIYASDMKRARETAEILFPGAKIATCRGLNEMDFGEFEYKTADEMENFAPYRQWVEGMCQGKCPGGESQAEFIERVCKSVAEIMAREEASGKTVVLVVHGGTLMAALSRFAAEARSYWDWHASPSEGWMGRWENGIICDCRPVKRPE